MALAQFSRVRLQTGQCATVLRCSTRMFAAQLHPNDSVSNPGDAFAAQLQAKTERELLELLERRNSQPEKTTEQHSGQQSAAKPQPGQQQSDLPREEGGPRGPEPTRFGDWEQKGRCSDF